MSREAEGSSQDDAGVCSCVDSSSKDGAQLSGVSAMRHEKYSKNTVPDVNLGDFRVTCLQLYTTALRAHASAVLEMYSPGD